MKIEKRGKYAGVKVHLDPEECQAFLSLAADVDICAVPALQGSQHNYFSLSVKLGRKLVKLMEEEPDTLKERTPEQVAAVVEAEYLSAQDKLNAIKGGQDWKKLTKSVYLTACDPGDETHQKGYGHGV